MADPRTTLEKVIQTAIDSSLKEVHTSMPGVVQSFDPVEQLADIQPTIQRKQSGELVNLPLLVDVPVRFPKVSDFCITLPLKEDDEVLIIISERSIDNWLLNGGIQPAGDIRKHSLSDAYAIPMLYSQENKILSFDPDNIQIRSDDGSAFITIDTSGNILLNGNADFVTAYTDMKTAFDQLKTDLNALITAYNAHIHITTATIGASATPGVISPTVSQGTPSAADMSAAKVDNVKVP